MFLLATVCLAYAAEEKKSEVVPAEEKQSSSDLETDSTLGLGYKLAKFGYGYPGYGYGHGYGYGGYYRPSYYSGYYKPSYYGGYYKPYYGGHVGISYGKFKKNFI